MTSESKTSRPSTSKAAAKSSGKKLTPDQKRAKLDDMMKTTFRIHFEPSKRVEHLYTGQGIHGGRIVVRFDKTNFKVIVGKPSTEMTLRSVSLGEISNLDNVAIYIQSIVNAW